MFGRLLTGHKSQKDKMDPPKDPEKERESKNSYVTVKWKEYTNSLDFSLRPVIVQTVKPKAATMNHSYRDFSRVPPPPQFEAPSRIKDMTFSQKVHHMLSQEHFQSAITWMPHGRAFKVLVPKTFEKGICPVYFGHSRYSSFLRDLNKFGFKHITKGDDRNCTRSEGCILSLPTQFGFAFVLLAPFFLSCNRLLP